MRVFLETKETRQLSETLRELEPVGPNWMNDWDFYSYGKQLHFISTTILKKLSVTINLSHI